METKPKKLAEFWADCERISAEREVLYAAVADAERALKQAKAVLQAHEGHDLLWLWQGLRQAGYEP